MPKRQRLATGIYRDAFGVAVIYSAHGRPVETRFPADRPLDTLIRWRAQQQRNADAEAPRDPRGSLARDIVDALKHLKGLPSYKSEKAHLKAWLHALRPGMRRWQLTPALVAQVLADWRQAGYAARTIRHRVRALRAVYRRLDGPTARTPLDEVTLPPKPRPRPIAVADATITAVALELYKHERLGWLRDAKTRARFLVLATTGRRPVEVQRARREDVDLERRLWFTRTAKGGPNNVLPLNEEQVAAWRLFAQAGAWGAYDTRSFARVLYRCGWPKGIRPYHLRHATAFAVRRRGGDPGHVQAQLGHASIATGAFYFTDAPEQQQATSAALDGRLGTTVFLPRTATTNGRTRKAKGRESAGNLRGSR